jgi:hypothetical protein
MCDVTSSFFVQNVLNAFLVVFQIFIIIIIIIIIIIMGYGLDDRGSRVRFTARAGNVSLHHRFQNGSETTQPPIQWVLGALSLRLRRPRREADHSPLSSSEVKE